MLSFSKEMIQFYIYVFFKLTIIILKEEKISDSDPSVLKAWK